MHKIYMFSWRACREGLPYQQTLQQRNLPLDNTCIFCMDSVETTSHALFYCSKLKYAWFHSITCMKEVKPNLTFLEIVVRVWKRGVPKDFTKFFLIAWGLWSWRNKKIFKNASLTLELVIENTLFNDVFFIDCNRVPPSEYRRASC